VATLHLKLDANCAAEHAALAEAISRRGGRVQTIVRWLEHALDRALEVRVAPYPVEVARAEYTKAADHAREVAEHCPAFAEQISAMTKRAAKAKSAEELAVLTRQVTDNVRRAVDALLDQQRRAAPPPCVARPTLTETPVGHR
jgi:methyl-accepting chemotaxis protein